jgi:hypothetical protein
MIFHDTHFNIGDLPCKSQSRASLGKFCANVVPEEVYLVVFQKKADISRDAIPRY